jgi:diaminopimelate epimerase
MQQLNLPVYPLRLKHNGNSPFVFDEFRSKWLSLTPEEWVRQHFAHYLVQEKKFPKGRMALEYSIQVNKQPRRCDIVYFNEEMAPELIVECKAPDIPINQKVFDQIVRYNFELKVPFLVVTNGIKHFACRIDYKNMKYDFLTEIPSAHLI